MAKAKITSVRLSPSLRAMLLDAAAANKRSLSAEIEVRLERSVLVDALLASVAKEWRSLVE